MKCKYEQFMSYKDCDDCKYQKECVERLTAEVERLKKELDSKELELDGVNAILSARALSEDKVAEVIHGLWCHWMIHQFAMCEKLQGTNDLLIPEIFVKRWKRQMETGYKDLPDNEKKSDIDLAKDTICQLVLPTAPIIKDLSLDGARSVIDFQKNRIEELEAIIKAMEKGA
jgi:hypothetical protein